MHRAGNEGETPFPPPPSCPSLQAAVDINRCELVSHERPFCRSLFPASRLGRARIGPNSRVADSIAPRFPAASFPRHRRAVFSGGSLARVRARTQLYLRIIWSIAGDAVFSTIISLGIVLPSFCVVWRTIASDRGGCGESAFVFPI